MSRLEALFDRFRRQSDAGALAEVFDALAPDLLRLARHLVRDRAEAEDLVQATFLAAIERRASFDATRGLRPWLVGILVREAARSRRARSREPDPRRLDSRGEPAPDDALAARELSDALAAALERLSPAEREVLVPVLLDGKRAVEVARELGARPDTIHMRVHRGIARLRKLLPAGIGLGVLARLADARSLARVKGAVLEGAGVELAVAGGAAAAGSLVGGLLVKKSVLAAAVLLAAGVAWVGVTRFEHRRTPAVDARREAPALAGTEAPRPAPTDADDAPAEARLALGAAGAPSAGTTTLELVDAADEPVAGARVAFLARGGEVISATTDAAGTCVVERAGETELYVLRESALCVRVRVDLSPSRSRAVLPEAAEVSGAVRFVDRSSPEGLALVLASDRTPAEIAGASAELLAALGTDGTKRSDARATLDASGRFRFRGLPAEWSGTLRLPQTTWLCEVGPRNRASDLVLAGPARGLEIVLEYRPAVRGRLVDAASAAAIPGAVGTAVLASPAGDLMYGFAGDGLGSFRMVLEDQRAFTSLRFVGLHAADGRPYALAEPVRFARGADGGDLGDVACEPLAVRTIRLRVVDPDGRGVDGARIEAGVAPPAETDELGRAEVRFVPSGLAELRIGARGFAVGSLDLRRVGEQEEVVRLRPTNRLVARIAAAEVPRATRMRIAVVAAVPLFGPGPDHAPRQRLARMHAGNYVSGSTERGGTRFESRFEPQRGLVEIDELRTDAPFEVRLLDPFGTPIASVACPPLGATEQREVLLPLPGGLRTIAGRVVDPQGRPLARSHVLYSSDAGGFGGEVDNDGRFRLEHVVGDGFGVTVSCRRFASVTLAAERFPTVGELEVRLAGAYDVRILVVDADGAGVRGARVAVAGLGIGQDPEEVAPGEFLLRNVADQTLAIRVDVAGARYERAHPSTDPIARIELPRLGGLSASWSGVARASQDEELYLVLIPLDPGREPLREWVPWASAGEHRIEAVLPGSWTVTLVRARTGEDAPETKPTALAPARTVEVRAGEGSHVVFAP